MDSPAHPWQSELEALDREIAERLCGSGPRVRPWPPLRRRRRPFPEGWARDAAIASERTRWPQVPEDRYRQAWSLLLPWPPDGDRILQAQSLLVPEPASWGLRSVDLTVLGSRFRPPAAALLPTLWWELLAWIPALDNRRHPVVAAAHLHLRLTTVYPFFDGNGRVARLLMATYLAARAYPPPLIGGSLRSRYLKSLEEAQVEGRTAPFVLCVLQAIRAAVGSMPVP